MRRSASFPLVVPLYSGIVVILRSIAISSCDDKMHVCLCFCLRVCVRVFLLSFVFFPFRRYKDGYEETLSLWRLRQLGAAHPRFPPALSRIGIAATSGRPVGGGQKRRASTGSVPKVRLSFPSVCGVGYSLYVCCDFFCFVSMVVTTPIYQLID